MIPSALARQLEQGLADFLRFSFWSSTPGMKHVVDDLLAEPGALVKGPYVSLKLPFVSGTNPRFFPDVPLDFVPHRHQEQAFARLGGRRKLSTLIATGTGSGKTEAFLLPILDHCLAEAGQSGVKAILIYPMNALAGDQAGRIARLIHGNDRLRGRVTAGLYIGEYRRQDARGETRMGPSTVITDRATMQASPPHILLTNYKMLDYLLLRPDDQTIWQHNARGTLRFLVVDEIHTFDGAQGTDLACLLRRLKRRLQVDDGSLCCVGTSATLGGAAAAAHLRQYARDVFGEPFDEQAVIGEARLDEASFLAGCARGPGRARPAGRHHAPGQGPRVRPHDPRRPERGCHAAPVPGRSFRGRGGSPRGRDHGAGAALCRPHPGANRGPGSGQGRLGRRELLAHPQGVAPVGLGEGLEVRQLPPPDPLRVQGLGHCRRQLGQLPHPGRVLVAQVIAPLRQQPGQARAPEPTVVADQKLPPRGRLGQEVGEEGRVVGVDGGGVAESHGWILEFVGEKKPEVTGRGL